MKKVLIILLSLSVLFALAGCGTTTHNPPTDSMATTTPQKVTQTSTEETTIESTEPEQTQPAEDVLPEDEQLPPHREPAPSEPKEILSPVTETPEKETSEPEINVPTPKPETKPEQAAPVIPEPEQIPPQHTHSYIKTTVSPTCILVGYTTNTCDCGAAYTSDETPATGHKFSLWYTVKEPTYDTTGLDRRCCNFCGEAEEKVTGMLVQNHTHSFTDQITTQPTCSAPGWRQYSCDCGETYGEPIGLISHTYTVAETPADCYNDGFKTATCKHCGSVQTELTQTAKGHSFGSWRTVKEPTYTEAGLEQRVCGACGIKEEKTLSKLIPSHQHSYTRKITKEPTCYMIGVEKYTCACGDFYEEYLPSRDHDETVEETKANCYTDGCKTYTCKMCGRSRKEITEPAWGHDSVITVKEPHCQWPGMEVTTCSRCDFVLRCVPIAQLKHNFVHNGCESPWVCTRCHMENGYFHHNWNNVWCMDCGALVRNQQGHCYGKSGMCLKANCQEYDPDLIARVNTILDKILSPGMSEYAKAKAIHDYIINNIDYDIGSYIVGSVPWESYSAIGALVTGKSVCSGYAYLYGVMCQQAGLECEYKVGWADSGSHAWNQLKIDGKWYNVDTCWDDPISLIGGPVLLYDYFLVSDAVFYTDHEKDSTESYHLCPDSYAH